jgi:hypothetical protein
MRLWPRKRVVLEDLSRARVGEHQERDARSVLRDNRTVVAMGGAGYKTGAQGEDLGAQPTNALEVRREQ